MSGWNWVWRRQTEIADKVGEKQKSAWIPACAGMAGAHMAFAAQVITPPDVIPAQAGIQGFVCTPELNGLQ